LKKFFLFLAVLGLALSLTACSQNNENKSEKQNETTSRTEQEQSKTEMTGETEESKENIASNHFFTPFDGKLEHIHGLGYAGNKNAVFFAAHDGIKVYENGKWYQTKKEHNDYMGFNAVHNGFYTSGHPGEDSKLPNPLGIKRSFDNGKTLETVALEGEVDFHAMGVGYENHVIYVLSPHKNSLMDANELYVSEDEAKTWKEVRAKGLGEEIFSIAVHPSNPDIVAIAGKEGIYLSKDKGDNFDLITKGMQGTSVFLTEDHLWYGGYNDAAHLIKRSLSDGSEEEISLPKMKQDAVMYLAQNPKDDKEIIFSTFNGDIYQTKDGTKSWDLLVKEGNLQTGE
jgi:Sortilin, neurotensin receptor 3,